MTIILSKKGWIQGSAWPSRQYGQFDVKAGDALKYAIPAHTTDKIILFTTVGKFFTLDAQSLPGGRGHGEPVRLMIDLEEGHDFIDMYVHDPKRKLLVASNVGNGFVVAEKNVVANTRKGKQVLNVKADEEAHVCTYVKGDTVAVMGDNRKMLVFALSDLNEMGRGAGCSIAALWQA